MAEEQKTFNKVPSLTGGLNMVELLHSQQLSAALLPKYPTSQILPNSYLSCNMQYNLTAVTMEMKMHSYV
jgi:hypothetical protein